MTQTVQSGRQAPGSDVTLGADTAEAGLVHGLKPSWRTWRPSCGGGDRGWRWAGGQRRRLTAALPVPCLASMEMGREVWPRWSWAVHISLSLCHPSHSASLEQLPAHGDSEMTDRVRLVGRYLSSSAISRYFEELLSFLLSFTMF